MNSLIFTVLVRYMKVALSIVAFWLLLRAHDDVGGGLMAGLLLSFVIILKVLAGEEKNIAWQKISFAILGFGFLIALVGMNLHSSPIFDCGVALVTATTVALSIGTVVAEDEGF